MKQRFETLRLDAVVGGGQTIGTLADGRKCFVWGGLPGELVTIRVTKKKSKLIEGVVTEVHESSPERIAPRDPDSYLSTSPWQIMTFDAEQHYKAALVEEAFELHDVLLPDPIDIYSDDVQYGYRNKVEFSFYGQTSTTSPAAQLPPYSEQGVKRSATGVGPSILGDDPRVTHPGRDEEGAGRGSQNENEQLDLAFFRRGSKGKIPVDGTSLAREEINILAHAIRDLLAAKPNITARNLKTLLIRCDQAGNCVWQLYVKDKLPDIISNEEAACLPAQGGEVIYSDPRSPASRITERLTSFGSIVLEDHVLDVPFRYATEGFFQVNIPVYEQALRDMSLWLKQIARPDSISSPASQPSHSEGSALPAEPTQDEAVSEVGVPEEGDGRGDGVSQKVTQTIDLYSGVGTIGLTIGGENCTLIEIDENAVREMRRNIAELGSSAAAVLAPSEKALDHITSDRIVIVDPPRAGLHADVIARLLETLPPRIIYLSCNPVTQARDVALLCAQGSYGIRAHRGYNFFPRTPHIEHLVILDVI